MKQQIYLIIVMMIVFSACKNKENMSTTTDKLNEALLSNATAPVVLYKTTRDFSNYVTVIMNPGKNQIVSYPAPSDINESSKPVVLQQGYLLDRRGINENVVILDISVKDYSLLERAPSTEKMLSMILERNPLLELYYCGRYSDYRDPIAELNMLIVDGFPNCTKADIRPMQITL